MLGDRFGIGFWGFFWGVVCLRMGGGKRST